MQKLLSGDKSNILSAVLNITSMLLSIRGIVKSKSAVWSIVNMINAGISGYMLIKNTKKILKG